MVLVGNTTENNITVQDCIQYALILAAILISMKMFDFFRNKIKGLLHKGSSSSKTTQTEERETSKLQEVDPDQIK